MHGLSVDAGEIAYEDGIKAQVEGGLFKQLVGLYMKKCFLIQKKLFQKIGIVIKL